MDFFIFFLSPHPQINKLLSSDEDENVKVSRWWAEQVKTIDIVIKICLLFSWGTGLIAWNLSSDLLFYEQSSDTNEFLRFGCLFLCMIFTIFCLFAEICRKFFVVKLSLVRNEISFSSTSVIAFYGWKNTLFSLVFMAIHPSPFFMRFKIYINIGIETDNIGGTEYFYWLNDILTYLLL